MLILLMIGSWLKDLMGKPKEKPKEQQPEQRPVVYVYHEELPEEIFAIVRLTWYRHNLAISVDEIALIKEDSLYDEFPGVLRDALNAGADVSIKTSLEAEVLGIEVL